MNKKLSIFAIVLIIIGLIGSIWSGFFSMPYFMNKLQSYEEQINKESIVLDEKININKLDINTNYSSVIISKSDSDNVIIKTSGLNESAQLKVNTKGKTLYVKEEYKDQRIDKIKSIDDFVNKLIEDAFSNNRNMIMIYIPQDVDFNINSDAGIINIEDDLFLNDFNYKTNAGQLSLPNEIKKLEKMNITSQSHVSLELAQLLGIKNININCSGANISSDKYNLEEIEKYLPQKITINADNMSEDSISINSSMPISKNLIINGYKTDVYLNLPLDRFKFKFDIKAYNGIELNDFMSNIINDNHNKDDNYNEDENSETENIKEIKTIINKDEKVEYKIDISSSDLYFE
ncbi:MAG: DUF4097 family beta strand repeat-containing protein [Terrisporobacter sp.]|uniref:hypothetical protein n=1 Tax=Terrisporobacter sp. TaxID=1965305 RepID=UPI002FCA916B